MDAVAQIKNQFRVWDVNHDGRIDADEFGALMKRLDPNVSKSDMASLFCQADRNHNGHLDVNELLEFVFSDARIVRQVSVTNARIFMSHQQTKLAKDMKERWLSDNARMSVGWDSNVKVCKASSPPFNKVENGAPENALQLNAPCYGVIRQAIMNGFSSPEVISLADELRINIPKYQVDTFLQRRMPKVRPLIAAARERCECQAEHEAVQRMQHFVDGFERLDPASITNMEQWNKFIRSFVPPGWEQKLHFDDLLGNFGISDARARELRALQIEVKEPMSGKIETVSMEYHCFRWLSKAFVAYGVPGCLTDVVNLFFALTGRDYEGMKETTIVDVVNNCWDSVARRNVGQLWLPNFLMMDAECDDTLCWLLLESIHRHLGSQLFVLVQLPKAQELDPVEMALTKLERVTVFRDPDSKNLEAVKKNYAHII